MTKRERKYFYRKKLKYYGCIFDRLLPIIDNYVITVMKIKEFRATSIKQSESSPR